MKQVRLEACLITTLLSFANVGFELVPAIYLTKHESFLIQIEKALVRGLHDQRE